MQHKKYKISVVSIFVMIVILLMIPLNTLAQDPADDFLVSLDDPMAAFLESRAYAEEMGATAEFRKMEWVAVDPASNKIYLSMSEVNRTMSDDLGDIKLPANDCGVVYEAELDATSNISNLTPAIIGGPYDENAADGNYCDVNNISNPDSLFVDPQGNLWIGEDTSAHVNNMIWRWDGVTLKRFATLPEGAEATGVMITPNNDMFFSVQHPSGMSQYPYNRSAVVAVTGWKADQTFQDVPVPTGDDMRTVVMAAGEPQVLARVGEIIPEDMRGQRWGQINTARGAFDQICNQPDGNVFLPTNSDGTEGYLYTNYECRPATLGKMYIRQRSGGEGWEILEGENVDFASVNGTWNLCGSTATPWNTTLTSEEYEPVATSADWQANVEDMTRYMGTQANPYDYGWLVEAFPDPRGDVVETQLVKHYAMGRFSHENAMVMPDQKTVYHGDDGTGVVLFKFVADEAGDLSAGTLYAAKVTQNGTTVEDHSFDLEWIELGSASNDEIAEAIEMMELPQ
jgi:secreted PhoX family phosphatase